MASKNTAQTAKINSFLMVENMLSAQWLKLFPAM